MAKVFGPSKIFSKQPKVIILLGSKKKMIPFIEISWDKFFSLPGMLIKISCFQSEYFREGQLWTIFSIGPEWHPTHDKSLWSHCDSWKQILDTGTPELSHLHLRLQIVSRYIETRSSDICYTILPFGYSPGVQSTGLGTFWFLSKRCFYFRRV